MTAAVFAPSFPVVTLRPRLLVVSFDTAVRTCGWAVVGGGFALARHVAWVEVRNADLPAGADPRVVAGDRLRADGIDGDAVALLTSRTVAAFERDDRRDGDAAATAIVTVGLSNALRVGDPAGAERPAGTINLLLYLSVPLADEALLETIAIATEAKACAVLEAGVRSRRSGEPATGTGTDCVVVACPPASIGSTGEPYAGKHTRIGALGGASAYYAVRAGVRRWLETFG
jgi:adenosylcobinamide amidohydrolase